MGFFARPDLSNEQFRQEVGSELTLSGQTQIATISGLTLATGNTTGTGVIITASGASSAMNNYVLTYDDIDKKIKLKESSASGGTGVYPYPESATTTVGGLPAGQNLYNEKVVDILHDILVPTLPPTLTDPTLSSFTITPSTLLYEVGCNISICGDSTFNPGCINPQYTAICDWRSCGVDYYQYGNKGVFSCTTPAIPSIITDNHDFGTIPITVGNNQLSSQVYYLDGVQPYDSNGGTSGLTALPSGNTAASTKNICGVYPWYWGIEASGGAAAGVNRPSGCCVKDVITGGTYGCKCVGLSTGTLFVNFGSTSDDYIWFATPCASTTKTWWYIDALNNNAIGGAVSSGGNLFPDPENITGITTTCWNGQEYKIYISNYQSCSTSIMELRNS